MSDLLFLDTEWATDAMRELVSLALVNADGTKRFYAERDPLPEVASTFVRTTVYPLLSRGDDACPDYEFTQRLREFVASGNNPRIHFDAMLDKVQLNHALAQFGYDKHGVPPYVPVFVSDARVLDELERYFKTHPEALARRHHAMVDAEALRYAYMKALN